MHVQKEAHHRQLRVTIYALNKISLRANEGRVMDFIKLLYAIPSLTNYAVKF